LKKKKARGEDKEGSGSKKKAKRSSEAFFYFHNSFPLGTLSTTILILVSKYNYINISLEMLLAEIASVEFI